MTDGFRQDWEVDDDNDDDNNDYYCVHNICIHGFIHSYIYILTYLHTHILIHNITTQVELYTHNNSFQQILQQLSKSLDCRLCSIHLIDSYYCTQPSTFISATLLVISTMLKLGLPHVNVLSKVNTSTTTTSTATMIFIVILPSIIMMITDSHIHLMF